MRVVIAGGGFAGASVARALRNRAEVTMVSSDNFLLFTPMLAEVAAGDLDPRHIIAPLRQLAPEARMVQGIIEQIEPAAVRLKVQPFFGGRTLTVEGDFLVVALGSVPNTFGVPGVEEYSLPFKAIGDALRIRNRLLGLMETSTNSEAAPLKVAVVGAGFSGAEVATALADFLHTAHRRFYPEASAPEVALIDAVERLTPALSPDLSAAAMEAVTRRGIKVRLGSPVIEVGAEGVRLGSGELVEAGTVIWAAGVKGHPLVATMDLPAERGRLVVDGHLRATAHVFAAGDAALVPAGGGTLSSPTAQFALRQGRYLGQHLPDLVAGKAVPEFSYDTKGELVSLGHHNAVGRVLGLPVSGLLGWFLWRSYYLLQLPTLLRKARVAMDWTLDVLFPPDIAWLPSSDLGPQ
ncbi:MAG: NAD(P)/FAD-dependent oxidoreductase [Actinomycetota bacterium]